MNASIKAITKTPRYACVPNRVVVFVFFTALFTASAGAATLQVGPFEHNPVPGGIAIINSGLSTANGKTDARFGKKPIAVMDHNATWHAIVGVALSTKPGTHKIVMKQSGIDYQFEFDVLAYEYEEQRIVIKDKRKVNPAPLDMQRIKKENTRIAAVKAYRFDALLAHAFSMPAEGTLSSPFGLRRFFNDQPRRPHGGIDIAAPTGTPVYAPAAGLIVDTGNYFFNGNSIFIEHGLGLQTFYAHLSEFHVKAGDKVAAGDLIGEIGATGRVTGPHLHWSVGLNGTWINPSLVLQD